MEGLLCVRETRDIIFLISVLLSKLSKIRSTVCGFCFKVNASCELFFRVNRKRIIGCLVKKKKKMYWSLGKRKVRSGLDVMKLFGIRNECVYVCVGCQECDRIRNFVFWVTFQFISDEDCFIIHAQQLTHTCTHTFFPLKVCLTQVMLVHRSLLILSGISNSYLFSVEAVVACVSVYLHRASTFASALSSGLNVWVMFLQK